MSNNAWDDIDTVKIRFACIDSFEFKYDMKDVDDNEIGPIGCRALSSS